MNNFRDYYEILGIVPEADAQLIKRTYRQLARQYHPDLNPGNQSAEERFKQLNEAYEMLSDPEHRRQYDEYRRYWLAQKNAAEFRRPFASIRVGIKMNFPIMQFAIWALMRSPSCTPRKYVMVRQSSVLRSLQTARFE